MPINCFLRMSSQLQYHFEANPMAMTRFWTYKLLKPWTLPTQLVIGQFRKSLLVWGFSYYQQSSIMRDHATSNNVKSTTTILDLFFSFQSLFFIIIYYISCEGINKLIQIIKYITLCVPSNKNNNKSNISIMCKN